MKSNIFFRVIIGLMFVFAVKTAFAQVLTEDEAKNFANTKGKEILVIFQEDDIEKRYEQIDEMLKKYVDIDYISKFVLGKYWREMTADQKKEYKEIFTDYSLAFYKTLPLEYAKNFIYDVVGVSSDSEKKFVNVMVNLIITSIENPQEVSLTFRLHKVNDVIKVVDVKVAESSLLLSYRGKFYEQIVQNDGEIDWFLEDLKDMTSSMKKKLRENVLNQQNSLEIEEKTE